ncbi:MAG: hypothetical protein HY880_09295 [Deltaproteobacteria bacterium]|nr:hypothetical protein [Deltaproteobacteria bacterium]
MNRYVKDIMGSIVLIFFAMCVIRVSHAAAACSKVSMEILQELTLERIAFDAKLAITNNIPDKDLTNIRVDVTIKDADGNVKNDLFYMRISSTNNIDSVDGNGVVKAATTGEVHWLIIPSPGAGGNVPAGVPYWAGATLTYSVEGKEEVVAVNPDRIIVKPEAQLMLDYFLPYEVFGDNPFTPQVEASVPFPVAVRILNAGYGNADNLKVDSAQPKIVSNNQGLLASFTLLGASVNDAPVQPSLSAQVGTLESKKIVTAYWEMLSTLSGRLVEFSATFSHASDLGGELTSLMKETNTYYFVHRVKANLPGRDDKLDILADTDKDPDHFPDAIFESEIPGGTGKVEDARTPVKMVFVASPPDRPTSQSPDVGLSLATGDIGWVYARMTDPSMGMLKLLDVIRADGVHLDPNNFWISEGLDRDYQRTFTLHLLDYRSDVSVTGTYTLKFTPPAEDTVPPVTGLIFDGPSKGANPVYITPETRVLFTAVDNEGGSGVDRILKKIAGTDADFVPAFPFNIETRSSADLEYYSLDRAGNKEAAKRTAIYVDDSAPAVISFTASPSTFMPNAPKGIAATRTVGFTVKASDDMNTVQAAIDIAKGTEFSDANIIKTLSASLASNVAATIQWDGKDRNGSLVTSGVYSARLSVTDGLNGGVKSHTSTATASVTAAEWFKGTALDPALSGAQLYPKVSETKIVWQDNRNDNWDIYMKDIAGGNSITLTSDISDQIRPAISGSTVVWQDSRGGNWNIYAYDISTGSEFIVSDDLGNQEMPVISGDWAAWQDDSRGNWDIVAYNLNTHETLRVTSHERDQMHPAISGPFITWEDYRHGPGEIYKYDLNTRSESRYTDNIANKMLPSIAGNTVAWTDQRNNQMDIYCSKSPSGEVRVTYSKGDHSQSALLNDIIVFTDYEAGSDDPNLSFFDIKTGVGARLTDNPARQEEPSLGPDILAWQDNRDGIYQIYWADFKLETSPVEVEIRPGFNFIAVGDGLSKAYPEASDLIAANPNNIGIEKIIAYDSVNGRLMESSVGTLTLQKGMGIGLYASGSGVLEIGAVGETVRLALLRGVNYVGALAIPYGYKAYSLLESVGLDNIQSVRRFDKRSGMWETAAVRETSSGKQMVGVNFVIRQGDGLIITMKNRVDSWKP